MENKVLTVAAVKEMVNEARLYHFEDTSGLGTCVNCSEVAPCLTIRLADAAEQLDRLYQACALRLIAHT